MVKSIGRKGGLRAGAGRSPLYKKPLISLSLSMRPEDRKTLEKIGRANGGSLSNSLRIALDFYREQHAPAKPTAAQDKAAVVEDGGALWGTPADGTLD